MRSASVSGRRIVPLPPPPSSLSSPISVSAELKADLECEGNSIYAAKKKTIRGNRNILINCNDCVIIGDSCTIMGGAGNALYGSNCTVRESHHLAPVEGNHNCITSNDCIVTRGSWNTISGDDCVILEGDYNILRGHNPVNVGGKETTIIKTHANSSHVDTRQQPCATTTTTTTVMEKPPLRRVIRSLSTATPPQPTVTVTRQIATRVVPASTNRSSAQQRNGANPMGNRQTRRRTILSIEFESSSEEEDDEEEESDDSEESEEEESQESSISSSEEEDDDSESSEDVAEFIATGSSNHARTSSTACLPPAKRVCPCIPTIDDEKHDRPATEQDDKEGRACIICRTNFPSTVMLDCAHQVMCIQCSRAWWLREQRQSAANGLPPCVICKKPVKKVARVFGCV